MTSILFLAGKPVLSGTAEACRACAAHYDLVLEMVTHDGTKIERLHDGTVIEPWDGFLDLPPRVAREGDAYMDGTALPPLCDLAGEDDSNVIAFDPEPCEVVPVAQRRRRRRVPALPIPPRRMGARA